MPQTGPGGSDNHSHSFEWGGGVTGQAANGHIHLLQSSHVTSATNGHLHSLPVKAPRGIDQDEFDRRTGQDSESPSQ